MLTEQRTAGEGAARRAGHLAAVIANLLLLWAANNLLAWQLPFITDAFIAALPVVNISFLASIAGHAILVFYAPRAARHLLGAAMNAASFASTYTLLVIFPFTFGAWDQMARIVLVLALVATAIAIVVDLARLVFGRE